MFPKGMVDTFFDTESNTMWCNGQGSKFVVVVLVYSTVAKKLSYALFPKFNLAFAITHEVALSKPLSQPSHLYVYIPYVCIFMSFL